MMNGKEDLHNLSNVKSAYNLCVQQLSLQKFYITGKVDYEF